jgi:hypothetical protein
MGASSRSYVSRRYDQATALGLDGKVEDACRFVEVGIIVSDQIDSQAT